MSQKQRVNDIQKKERLTDDGVQLWDGFYIHMSPGEYIITVQDRNGNPWVSKTTAKQVKQRILRNESTVNDILQIISKKPKTGEEKAIIKYLKEILSENNIKTTGLQK